MKTLKKSSLIFAVLLLFAACAKDKQESAQKPTGDSDACSSQFSFEFNDIVAKTKAVKASDASSQDEKLGKYQELNRVCEHFFSQKHPTLCQGYDGAEAKTRALSVREITPACDEAKKYVQDNSPAQPTPTPGPSSTPSPNPQPSLKTFAQYQAKAFKVAIADLAAVKKAFNDQKLVFAGGRVKSLREAGAVHCVFSSSERDEWNRRFAKGMSLQATEKDEASQASTWIRRRLHLRLEAGGHQEINFGCGKTSAEPFTISEVREAVRGILELRIAVE